MRNKKRNFVLQSSYILLLGAILITIFSSSVDATSGVNVEEALQQTAYAYYMRGYNLQYSSRKSNSSGSFFAPEEATGQDMRYAVCSAFAENVYYDLLGNVKLPADTDSLTKYARDFHNTTDPSNGNGQAGWGVVMYGERQADNSKKTTVYNPSTGEKIQDFTNMTIDDLIPYLKPGDVLTYRTNGSGHTIMIYDLVEGAGGAITNARTIESNGSNYVVTKVSKSTTIGSGTDVVKFGWGNHGLYLGKRQNTTFPDGREEGSIRLSTIRDVGTWKNFDAGNKYDYYSVLRLLSNDGSGNTILSYQGANYGDSNHNNQIINNTIPQKVRDRIKYPKLFIEKTVDVFEDSTVEEGDILTYKIRIKNESDAAYTDSLDVTEQISPLADYKSYTASKTVSFAKPATNLVSWNIGTLSSGEEVVIEYKIKVKDGTVGEVIESTGTVANLNTSTVMNLIQQKVADDFSDRIETAFDDLKGTYEGKELIDEIYKKVSGNTIDLGVADLDLHDLINNNPINSPKASSISLNVDNPLYNIIFNRYWSTMLREDYEYKGESVYAFDQKQWQGYNAATRRSDMVYEETLKTGDILVYLNENDVSYGYDASGDTVTKTPITYENGEYAYIFIEGRGFVGVNLGNNRTNPQDDRNNFNVDYYTENRLPVYSNASMTDEAVLKAANYQTLFGKDYYVILRPSLVYDTNSPSANNPNTSDSLVRYLLIAPFAGILALAGATIINRRR